MTNQQLFVLIFTFIVGLVAGVYFYVTSFAPQYGGGLPQTNAELVIVAEQIGGCQMLGVCPYFRLESNRSFEYIPEHSLRDEIPEPVTGKISRERMQELEDLLKALDLTSLQRPGDVCLSAVDGIDYRYDLLLEGVSYELTSCGTTFYGSRLYNQLLLVWGDIIKGVSEGENVTDFEGVLPIFIDRFRNDE